MLEFKIFDKNVGIEFINNILDQPLYTKSPKNFPLIKKSSSLSMGDIPKNIVAKTFKAGGIKKIINLDLINLNRSCENNNNKRQPPGM